MLTQDLSVGQSRPLFLANQRHAEVPSFRPGQEGNRKAEGGEGEEQENLMGIYKGKERRKALPKKLR